MDDGVASSWRIRCINLFAERGIILLGGYTARRCQDITISGHRLPSWGNTQASGPGSSVTMWSSWSCRMPWATQINKNNFGPNRELNPGPPAASTPCVGDRSRSGYHTTRPLGLGLGPAIDSYDHKERIRFILRQRVHNCPLSLSSRVRIRTTLWQAAGTLRSRSLHCARACEALHLNLSVWTRAATKELRNTWEVVLNGGSVQLT